MTNKAKEQVLLIHASSYLYRSYYGMRPLHTPQGEPVHAVYSFCRMIKKLLMQFNPRYVALVWDSKEKTTRHELYEEYKATRQAPPSDLFTQKERIVEFANLIGCLQVEKPGIEADDLMYSIAHDVVKKGYSVVVVTSDKDMGQMLSGDISIYDPLKDVLYTPETFQEKMGFPVDRLVFYFALLGDVSDNIPGVKGIGKKTAEELVTQFASLDDMYAHLDTIEKKRTKDALERGKKEAYLSRDLFLLRYYPHGVTLDDLSFNPASWSNANPLFEELHFKSLLIKDAKKEISIEDKKAYWKHTYSFITVTTLEQLRDVIDQIKHVGVCALDTETNGIQPLETLLVGISLCMHEGTAYYIPCGHVTDAVQLPRDVVLAELKLVLEDERYKKYLHNAKFDQKVLHSYGIELRGITCDTMIAASLVVQEGQRVGLKRLSLGWFNEDMLSYSDLVTAHKLPDFSYVSLEDATLY